MKLSARTVTAWVGAALSLAGCAFLVERFITLEVWRHPLEWTALAPALGLGAVAYSLTAIFFQGGAWGRILGEGWPAWVSIRLYTLVQPAKYLPGNVLHLVGRHVLFLREGVSHTRLAIAAGVEALSLCAAALGLALILGPALPPAILRGIDGMLPALPHWAPAVAPVFALGGFAGLIALAPRFGFTRRGLTDAMILHLFHFAVCGTVLFFVLNALGADLPSAQESLLLVALAVFPIAWVVGYVVPGTPGGLGIREALLTLLMAPVLGQETALIGALLLRVITVAGDGIAVAIVAPFGRRG